MRPFSKLIVKDKVVINAQTAGEIHWSEKMVLQKGLVGGIIIV